MKKSETKLLNQYRALPKEAQISLLNFCEFLTTQHPPSEQIITTPKYIPRPANESVVLAMRRLSETYPMLEKDKILHDASSLMSQHILQGREAKEVIDDLEVLFKKYYDESIAITQDEKES